MSNVSYRNHDYFNINNYREFFFNINLERRSKPEEKTAQVAFFHLISCLNIVNKVVLWGLLESYSNGCRSKSGSRSCVGFVCWPGSSGSRILDWSCMVAFGSSGPAAEEAGSSGVEVRTLDRSGVRLGGDGSLRSSGGEAAAAGGGG